LALSFWLHLLSFQFSKIAEHSCGPARAGEVELGALLARAGWTWEFWEFWRSVFDLKRRCASDTSFRTVSAKCPVETCGRSACSAIEGKSIGPLHLAQAILFADRQTIRQHQPRADKPSGGLRQLFAGATVNAQV
jgi:hypothetical protein